MQNIEQLIKECQLEWIIKQLVLFAQSRFYGKFTLQYEDGQITFGRKEETFKPPNRKTEDKG